MKSTKQGVRDLGGNDRRTKTVGTKLPEPPKQEPHRRGECPHLWHTVDGSGILICSVCLEEI